MQEKLQLHQQFIAGLTNPSKAALYINLFWNMQIDYKAEPLTNLQQKDHWQTPEETLQRGTGDCEDIAIGKYFDLQGLGLKPTLAFAFANGKAHMLCICMGAELDNQCQPTDIVFTFNNTHVYVKDQACEIQPGTLFPQWQQMIDTYKATDRQIERLAHVTGNPIKTTGPAT